MTWAASLSAISLKVIPSSMAQSAGILWVKVFRSCLIFEEKSEKKVPQMTLMMAENKSAWQNWNKAKSSTLISSTSEVVEQKQGKETRSAVVQVVKMKGSE